MIIKHKVTGEIIFNGADLRGADLNGADLSRADLSGADLRDTKLRGADLSDADLRGADLRGADLRGADLQYTIGNASEIKTIQLPTYHVCITNSVIQIGCEKHSIEDWKNFSDDIIHKMDDGALEWWKTWKPVIFMIIENNS